MLVDTVLLSLKIKISRQCGGADLVVDGFLCYMYILGIPTTYGNMSMCAPAYIL